MKSNNLDESTIASDFMVLHPISSKLNLPIKVKFNLKRALGSFESSSLYRINDDYNLLTKIESTVGNNEIKFDTQSTGTFVVKYEKNYSVLIGSLIGVGAFIILIGSVSLFLYKNPKYIHRLRYTTCNAKRSMSDEI